MIQPHSLPEMAEIIVYHYSEKARVPALSPQQAKEIRAKFDEVLKDFPGVIFHGVFVNENGQGICRWDAPDVATVVEIVTRVDGHPPVDGAVAVKQIL